MKNLTLPLALGIVVGGIAGYFGADRLATYYFGNSGLVKNGWAYAIDYGKAEPPTLAAAAFAKHVMVANVAEEAVYYKATGNAGNDRSYVITFGPEQFPPVKAFWSLTLYYGELPYNLVKNSIDRSVISDRTEGLKFGPDGSLEVRIQNQQPAGDKAANWLPAPDGDFLLVLRAYWPEEAILNGSYAPPALRLVGSGG